MSDDKGLRRQREARESPESWAVSMLNGPMAGSAWPLTAGRLTIGRGLGCQICVDDPSVSRLQCELVLENSKVTFYQRSKSSPTTVNGEARRKTTLRTGDEIAFCGYRLIVDLKSNLPVTQSKILSTNNTTQQFSDSIYLNEPTNQDTPLEFSRDLVRLYKVLKTLARAKDLDTLIGELQRHIRARFGRAVCWMSWGQSGTSDLVLFPPVSKSTRDYLPRDEIGATIRMGVGMLSEDGTIICAPLVQASGSFGAVAVTRSSRNVPFAKVDLHYLLALAEGLSPIVIATERMEQMRRDLRQGGVRHDEHGGMIGKSEGIQELRARLQEAARSNGNVLILGETGVGKELAARRIHDLSGRASGPYVAVNCAAVPEELFQSEVFGHEKGAFTGATQQRKGLYEQAHGGTLFLDEVAELSKLNQARLLRVTESKALRRLGGKRDIAVDVRIVSATNRRLPDSDENHLRIDLYYRLSGFSIWIPPLRERRDDIPELASHFLNEFAVHSPTRPNAFSEDAMNRLNRYHWPGNIRELRNVVERACYRAAGRTVEPEDILLETQSSPQDVGTNAKTLREIEREQLIMALSKHAYNVADTARSLGIAASTLYYKVRRHGIRLRKG